jgi:hypothetical protein
MGQGNTKAEQFLIPEEQFTMNVRTILFEPMRCAGIQAISMDRNLSVEEQQELLKRRWIFDEDGYWRKDGRIFIPSRTSIEKTIKEHHDTLYAGHPGILGTAKLIKRHGYWWWTMNTNIKTYIKGCTKCQRTKADRTKKGWISTSKYCTNRTMGRNIDRPNHKTPKIKGIHSHLHHHRSIHQNGTLYSMLRRALLH